MGVLSNAQLVLTLAATFLRAGRMPLRLLSKYHPQFFPSDYYQSMFRWIYALILAIDANFRLKNKDRNITNDVPLGDGWAHWVPEEPFMDYVGGYGYQEEVSTASSSVYQSLTHLRQPNMCDSQLRAVDHANTRFSRGYKSTGVGGVVCARHGLVRKNGLGDLQKGER